MSSPLIPRQKTRLAYAAKECKPFDYSQLINVGFIMWGGRVRLLSLGLVELQCVSYLCYKTAAYIRINIVLYVVLIVVHNVSCVHPQINTQNGGLWQQQAVHGDIVSELQSYHPVILQPAKEVCLCGTTTAQKSDTSLGSITDTSRHSCDWSSGRSASAAPFTL